MEQYILAHDFGTSGDKATLFTTEGKLVKTVTKNYKSHYSNNDWVEQDPEDWWNAFCENNKVLLEGIDAAQVLCVAFDGTFPNCTCVDENGKSIYPAIMWQDVRTSEITPKVAEKLPKKYIPYGVGFLPYQTLTRMVWLREYMPDIYEKADKVLTCAQDYIVIKLTGRALIETTMATATAMMAMDETDWSDEVLELFDIPREKLPQIVPKTEIAGEVPEALAIETGLAAATKLVLGGGDTQSTSIGAGLMKPGDAYFNGGTSAGIVVKERPGEEPASGLTASSGSSLSWLRDVICLYESELAEKEGKSVYDLINEEALKADIGSNGVFYHPYLAGERYPIADPNARGSFVGLSHMTKRQDIIRSVIEGIGFNINMILENVRSKGYKIEAMNIVGGLGKGAATTQIFADIMNVELRSLKYMDEAATVGTAVIGGMALGIYEDESAAEKFMEYSRVIKPNKANHEKYKKLMPFFKMIYEGLAPVYKKMKEEGIND